jgi:hypothetical protein
MLAVTTHAHHLLTLDVDNYAAHGSADTAIAALGSGFTVRHTQTSARCPPSLCGEIHQNETDGFPLITFIEQCGVFIEELPSLFGECWKLMMLIDG